MDIRQILSEEALADLAGYQFAEPEFEEMGKFPLPWSFNKRGCGCPGCRGCSGAGQPKGEAAQTIEEIGRKQPFWNSLKVEMEVFLCTKDKKYDDLRRKLNSASKKSETAIVSLIAASVAASMGLAAGAVVPLCALILLGIMRIGINAYCSERPALALDLSVTKIAPGKKAGKRSQKRRS